MSLQFSTVMLRLSALTVVLALAMPATAATGAHPGLRTCAAIADAQERLACFDALAATERTTEGPPPPEGHAEAPSLHTDSSGSRLSRLWELDPADKQAPFSFRPHRENYVLFANHSQHPNAAPYEPFRGIEPGARISHTELAFQLGFKLKLMQNALGTPVDIWAAYTQRSFWQAYNRGASAPFRETNYEPELMAVLPVDAQLAGWRLRMVNLGLLHQSNGQSSSLSRSWNRIYAQAGLERGNYTLLARIWKPTGDLSDNPDVTTFMGHGDLVGSYRWNDQELSVLLRRNFRTHHGAVQAAWSFPLAGEVAGYVQLFSGYGDSLINYNARQQTLGVGVRVGF